MEVSQGSAICCNVGKAVPLHSSFDPFVTFVNLGPGFSRRSNTSRLLVDLQLSLSIELAENVDEPMDCGTRTPCSSVESVVAALRLVVSPRIIRQTTVIATPHGDGIGWVV